MLGKIKRNLYIGLTLLVWLCACPAMAASESDEFLAAAKNYLSEGKQKSAIIELKNSLKSDPSNVEARILLGNIYLLTANVGGAQKELSRARRLGAPKDEWMVGLGQAMLLAKDFDTLLNEIIPDDSMSSEKHATALAIRGNAYLATGDRDKALEAFGQALSVQASNPLARLGKAQLLLGDRKLDEALQQFTEVLSEYPDHVETRLARGELYRVLKKLPEAEEDFSVAINKAPQNARGYIGRTLTYLAQQKLDEATKDLEALKRKSARLPVVNYLSALLAFQQKDLEKSSDDLQLVLRDAPDNVQAQTLYGIVSYARGQFTVADDYLSRVSARVGNNPQLLKLLGASRMKLKNPRGAVEVLKPLVEITDSQDVQALALLGTAHLLAGDNARGTEFLTKAVELDPEQALLRTQLAASRIALGDAEGAIPHLETAVKLGQDLLQADVLLVLGYLNQKQYDKAVKAALALEQRMPQSPVPSNLTGLAYMAQNEMAAAEKKYQEALEIDPSFVVATMNLARMSLLQSKPDMARGYYRKALKQSPGHEGALLALAMLESNAGNTDEAENWLRKANDANPKALRPILLLAELHLKRNEPLKAMNLFSGLTKEQARIPEVLRLKGLSHLQAGEFSSAKVQFQELAERQPRNIEAWFQLARAQAATGDGNASWVSFGRAIELDVDHKYPLVWIGKGEIALREKRFEEALGLAQEMQTYFPGNAMAYEIEAAAYRKMGDTRKAILALEKAVRAEGNSQRINLFAHTLASSGNAPKAVYMLEDWLQNNKEDGVSWSTLGMLRQQMGQDEKALQAYEEALKLTGGNPIVLNNMAWLYMERDLPRASHLARQAYETAPERAEIVDTYGWVLFRQGKHKQGLDTLQQALVIAPNNAEIGLHVAEALHHQGRGSEARPLLERVLRDHPHTASAAPARELLKKIGN